MNPVQWATIIMMVAPEATKLIDRLLSMGDKPLTPADFEELKAISAVHYWDYFRPGIRISVEGEKP